jgi:hypothetical protein
VGGGGAWGSGIRRTQESAEAACQIGALHSVMPPYPHRAKRRRVAGVEHGPSEDAQPAVHAAPPPACGIVMVQASHHGQRQGQRASGEARRQTRAVGCARCVTRRGTPHPCERRPVRIAVRPPHCVRPLPARLGDLRSAVLPVGLWGRCARLDGAREAKGRVRARAAVRRRLAARCAWQRTWVRVGVRAQGGAMDELGELIRGEPDATLADVMRSAVCRDLRLHVSSVSLTAADAAAFTPKERLVAELSAITAEETVATLAGVVGGWPDLRELRLSGRVEVSEATLVALAHALGHCTQLRELCLSFPLCPAAAAALVEALPRLSEVTRIEVGRVTTSSLLTLVHGLPGAACGAGDAARALEASVIGTGDPATTTDDLRELGSAVAAAGQRGWAIQARTAACQWSSPVELLAQVQVQALALRHDWRDCIMPLSGATILPSLRHGLSLRACGLVEANDGEIG